MVMYTVLTAAVMDMITKTDTNAAESIIMMKIMNAVADIIMTMMIMIMNAAADIITIMSNHLTEQSELFV